MIPLKDTIPSKRYPVITLLLIVVNVAVFFYELRLGPRLEGVIRSTAIVPARFFGPTFSFSHLVGGVLFPIFTSLFFHGGWFHLLGNMLYLWIFADNVEDRLGHFRFPLFYLMCGFSGGLAHIFANPSSTIPTIGSSGAIAGILGAYFVLFPHSRILTLVPLAFFIEVVELPAFIFLGLWFVMQFLQGMIGLRAGGHFTSGVAWWAHIGGFVSGILLVGLLLKRRKHRY